ncbi:solute carrier family 45, member 1/2/4 [Entomortierella parvispora]|uniref:Solute carrier family 45, member 1/2/4 n=1 Tax=Entomortierella parvispora TaxID=205924 RepID=A0A9P3H3J7_9FUNG|nr:solute carrier family 45, member 1/2/4 [Entomortierella parvispora]
MSDNHSRQESRALLASTPQRPGIQRHNQRRRSFLKRKLSLLDIARLTICMLGVQFTWTVELGYGTPYLLSLGIPKTLTPLVWLAGPLSGLIIQPIVGVFSDSLDWRLGRRRPFILIGAALTILSMYMVAYAKELALLMVGQSHQDLTLGSSDEEETTSAAVKGWTIGFAVVGFYCLDFSINAVQASCRSLIMDIPPTDQQEVCNAWSGWMNNLGSVVGFFTGNLDLVKYASPWLGNTQIKILANIAMISFITCLGITCSSVKEIQYQPTDEDKKRSVWSTIGNIWRALRKLPSELQRICNVQFFAWMGWFPFLFYSTTWVGEILNRYDQGGNGGDGTVAERAGSFALLCWAGLAVFTGILVPKVTPQEIGLEVWPRNPFTLRNLWTMSLVWFAGCMGMTWFVDDLWAATGVIALCGVPWAVAMWIPFAMVGEIISDMKDRLASSSNAEDIVDYGATHDDSVTAEDTIGPSNAAITHLSDEDIEAQEEVLLSSSGSPLIPRTAVPHLDAGLVLGVHNMYIVFPQFADAIIASCLFAMIGTMPPRDAPSPEPHLPDPGDGGGDIGWLGPLFREVISLSSDERGGPEPVGWVLRFGGVMALVAAYLSRRL